jgi:hypothetical protein
VKAGRVLGTILVNVVTPQLTAGEQNLCPVLVQRINNLNILTTMPCRRQRLFGLHPDQAGEPGGDGRHDMTF